jgi:hypothetical protein
VLSSNSASADRISQGEASGEPVEGLLHVETHEGYKDLQDGAFKYVDTEIRKQVDEVVKKWGMQPADGDVLTKVLERNMTWKEIEKGFMQSRFWTTDGSPITKTDEFDPAKTSTGFQWPWVGSYSFLRDLLLPDRLPSVKEKNRGPTG